MFEHQLPENDPLRNDFAEENRIYANICKTMRKQPGYVVDWDMVDKAWEICKDHHRDARRLSGDLYICHPRAVMEELARLRCKSSVLAAALLHDTMEDCNVSIEFLRENFSKEVAEIVSSVTAIKKSEISSNPKFASMSSEEQHDFLDRLTDSKLISSRYQREAFLVRFADRAHNLATIDACSTKARLNKIASTRAFLIPAARKLGMRYFEVILSDLCMRYDGEHYKQNESVLILDYRNKLTRVSGSAHSRFDQILQNALEHTPAFSFPKFNPFAKLRGFSRDGGEEMVAASRRVLLAYELKQQLDRVHSFDRSKLDLWEVILTYRDQDKRNMLADFTAMYRDYMAQEDLFIEYLGRESETLVIRMTDILENNYRVVLIPESMLEAYYIGNPDGERLTMISEDAPSDSLRPLITVYSYTPRKGLRRHYKRVPSGATALDFAFIIRPSLAFTVKSARIRQYDGSSDPGFTDTDYPYPLQTTLSEGDIVYFDADYHPADSGTANGNIYHVSFDWFLKVNTQHSKNCLVRYFKDKYRE